MEIRENIKTGLLAIIAITLAYDVFVQEAKETTSVNEHNHASAPPPPVSVAGQEGEVASNANVPSMPPTSVTFDKMEHDFGKVKQETQNKYLFKFKNTGTEPLLISNARGSCGCTVPTYPKEPIAPGGTGEIEVEYSPGQQQGSQAKTVTITANTEPTETILKITAQVEK